MYIVHILDCRACISCSQINIVDVIPVSQGIYFYHFFVTPTQLWIILLLVLVVILVVLIGESSIYIYMIA